MLHDGKAICILYPNAPTDIRYRWCWQDKQNYTLPIGAVKESASVVDGIIEADAGEVKNCAHQKIANEWNGDKHAA